MKLRKSAIKADLFGAEAHRKKLDQLGDPLVRIGSHIDFTALASEVDRVAPRPVSLQRPLFRYRGPLCCVSATLSRRTLRLSGGCASAQGIGVGLRMRQRTGDAGAG